jgi:hypothetical protein
MSIGGHPRYVVRVTAMEPDPEHERARERQFRPTNPEEDDVNRTLARTLNKLFDMEQQIGEMAGEMAMSHHRLEMAQHEIARLNMELDRERALRLDAMRDAAGRDVLAREVEELEKEMALHFDFITEPAPEPTDDEIRADLGLPERGDPHP